jgi:hypothetical protein
MYSTQYNEVFNNNVKCIHYNNILIPELEDQKTSWKIQKHKAFNSMTQEIHDTALMYSTQYNEAFNTIQ